MTQEQTNGKAREIGIIVREYGSGRNMIEQVTSLPPGEYNFIEYKAYRAMGKDLENVRAKYEKAVSALRLIAGPSAFNCAVGEGQLRAAAQKTLKDLGEEMP